MAEQTENADTAVGAFGRIKNNPSVQLLRNGPFRNLMIGNLSNFTGVELRLMAQAWLILELGGSQVWVGASAGLRVIPAIIIGLFAGVWVDRRGGKFMLLWERSSLLVLAALTALLVITNVVELWHVIVLSIVSSSILAAGNPAMTTLVMQYVDKKSLQSANSLSQVVFTSSRALGPMGGGFLIAGFGLSSPFLALIGLYAISIAAAMRLPKSAPKPSTGNSALTDIVEGLRYVTKNPLLKRLMTIAFTVVLIGGLQPVMPVYARDVFDVGETGFGTMMAVSAIGGFTAALWVSVRGGFSRKSRSMIAAASIYCVSQIGFAYSPTYEISLFFLFFAGFAPPLWMTSVLTMLQTESDPKMIGRVMALFTISIQFFLLGWFLGAWVGQQIGNDLMLVISAAMFFFIHAVLLVSSPALRRL